MESKIPPNEVEDRLRKMYGYYTNPLMHRSRTQLEKDAAQMFQMAADEINKLHTALYKIASKPCCNNCGNQKSCLHKPEWGDICAINCPLWVKMEEQHD